MSINYELNLSYIKFREGVDVQRSIFGKWV